MPDGLRKWLRLPNEGALPAGWIDIPAQIGFFSIAYAAYRVVQGVVVSQGPVAFQNARTVISIERSLHIFIEQPVQSWVSHSHLLAGLLSWLYVNAQFTITIGALLYLYFWRYDTYRGVRNALMIAMAIALVGYALFPTAPPRYLPEWGFVDTVSNRTGLGMSQDSSLFSSFVNPYAAVPSMHIAFALIIGWPLWRSTRLLLVRVLWLAYPLLIAFVIIATGNHFVLDTVLGALTAVVSIYAARRLTGSFDSRLPIASASTGVAG